MRRLCQCRRPAWSTIIALPALPRVKERPTGRGWRGSAREMPGFKFDRSLLQHWRCRMTPGNSSLLPEDVQVFEPTNMLPEYPLLISKTPLRPPQHDAASAVDCTRFAIGLIQKLVEQIVGDADVVGMAKEVLQRLQPFQEVPNLVLGEEALQEFDNVTELLQRNAQTVSLYRSLLCEPFAALSGPYVASFDQLRRSIGDWRQEKSGVLRQRLLPPSARLKPPEKAQRRFGVSLREDLLLRVVEGAWRRRSTALMRYSSFRSADNASFT